MTRIRTHPGEVLHEEFMVPLGLNARVLAAEVGLPPELITEIVRARGDVSADTAIRLGRRFGTTPHFWLNLQASHDLSRAEAENDYSAVQRAEDAARSA